jgi:hypothetical protein
LQTSSSEAGERSVRVPPRRRAHRSAEHRAVIDRGWVAGMGQTMQQIGRRPAMLGGNFVNRFD